MRSRRFRRFATWRGSVPAEVASEVETALDFALSPEVGRTCESFAGTARFGAQSRESLGKNVRRGSVGAVVDVGFDSPSLIARRRLSV